MPRKPHDEDKGDHNWAQWGWCQMGEGEYLQQFQNPSFKPF